MTTDFYYVIATHSYMPQTTITYKIY